MIDTAQYMELARALRDQGKGEVASAIDTLLESYDAAAKSAYEVRQEVVKQRGQISKLESHLGMIQGVRYQEMRIQLPEGGYVTLKWPDSMMAASADMIREMVDLQMKHHAQAIENRPAANQETRL